ncbi:hypothetical protein SUGI_1074870 [Cryptomeria japonica]|nr:hypothetical protein SUGI_1074870 [Cryptomeria japonica]
MSSVFPLFLCFNSLHPSLISQLQNSPILSPMNGQLDEHCGFDNLLDMEFTTEFGMVEHHPDQFLQEHTVSLPMGSEQRGRKEEIGHSAHTMPCLKKLSHNANERLRRKKLNMLYAELQALLPNANPNVLCFYHSMISSLFIHSKFDLYGLHILNHINK